MYIYRRTKNLFLLFLGSKLLLDTRKHQWFLTIWPGFFSSIGWILWFFLFGVCLFVCLFVLGFFWLLVGFFILSFFSSSLPSQVVTGIPKCFPGLCEFIIQVPHGLCWCIFCLILFMGGVCGGVLFVFWSARSSPLPLPPSPSLPWLSPESPFQWRASLPRPAFSGLTRACLDVLPRAHALLRSISLALTVLLRWNQAVKGFQLPRKLGMGFPQLMICFFCCSLSTLFLNSVWSLHTQSKTEKRPPGAFTSFAFSFIFWGWGGCCLWVLFIWSWDTEKPTPIFVVHTKIKASKPMAPHPPAPFQLQENWLWGSCKWPVFFLQELRSHPLGHTPTCTVLC